MDTSSSRKKITFGSDDGSDPGSGSDESPAPKTEEEKTVEEDLTERNTEVVKSEPVI
jgi:hypothetical protein